MKVNLKKIKNVVMEKLFLIRVIYMKENLVIINLMDMGIIFGLKMDMNIKEVT